MRDVLIVLQAMLKVINYFLPETIIFIIGLGILVHYDVKKDKPHKKKRTYRRQAR